MTPVRTGGAAIISIRPWQRATTRNGALWREHGKSGVFGPPPPTARQIENWQPVVYFPGNNAVFGFDRALWRAVERRLSGALTCYNSPSAGPGRAREYRGPFCV